MIYTSEKIEKIIRSPGAKRALDYIAPIYADAEVGLWLLESIGREIDDMVSWSDELKLQIVPQTATWAMDYYEDKFGLPTNPETPLEQRREAVLMTERTRAPINPAKLGNMASLTLGGIPVEIQERTGKNTFTAFLTGIPSVASIREMRKVIEKVKPAHLIYLVNALEKGSVTNWNEAHAYQLKMRNYVRNLGFKFTPLDGSRLLDGTWRLEITSKGVKLSHLKLNMSKENTNRLTYQMKYFSNIKNSHQNSVLNQMKMRSYIRNLGYEFTPLDASKTLDGTWKIQVTSKGVKLNKLCMSMSKENENLVTCRMKYVSNIKNPHLNFAANQMKMHSCIQNLTEVKSNQLRMGGVKVNNHYGNQATLTMDTMWKLNGLVKLNGERRLNAKIEKISL